MAQKRAREDSFSSVVAENTDETGEKQRRSQSEEATSHTPKYALLDIPAKGPPSMRCILPPHKPLNFRTYEDYEAHYQQSHTNRCVECKSNFPSSHFLELHIAENHDPIIASKREAGERTYTCFVEGCDKVCSEWKKRRSHLVDKHGYPKNYDFLVVDHGIDRRRSMLRAGVDEQGHRKSSRERGRSASSATDLTQSTGATSVSAQISPEASDKMEVAAAGDKKKTEKGDDKKTEVEELASSFSNLKMVPRSVTFGRKKGGGLAKS